MMKREIESNFDGKRPEVVEDDKHDIDEPNKPGTPIDNPNDLIALDKFESIEYDGWGSEEDRDEDAVSFTENGGTVSANDTVEEAMRLLAPDVQDLPRRSRGKYGKRKHLTSIEKAELTRQRNRENARSTRKRRKLFIAHLQQVVATLKSQQQSAINPQLASDPKLESSIHEQRTRNVLKFFELRSNGSMDKDQWLRIIVPDIRITLPITSYRAFPSNEIQEHLRVFTGVEALLADTASLHYLVRDTRNKLMIAASRKDDEMVKYTVSPSDFLLVDDLLMFEWRMAISFKAEKSKIPDLSIVGMGKCKFASSHCIKEMSLRFDVMGLTRLLDACISKHENDLQISNSSSSATTQFLSPLSLNIFPHQARNGQQGDAFVSASSFPTGTNLNSINAASTGGLNPLTTLQPNLSLWNVSNLDVEGLQKVIHKTSDEKTNS